MEKTLNKVVAAVRRRMHSLAVWLNKASGGKLTANTITLLSFAGHIPAAVLLGAGEYRWAALFIIVFGLMDALDGEIARLQRKATPSGMVFDATTDRLKEVLLYCGAAYSLSLTDQPWLAVWAVAACGTSLCVSYIKAKAETAVKDKNLSANEVNKLFADGLGRYEVRMAILILSLLGNRLPIGLILITLISLYTLMVRMARTARALES